MMLSEQLRTGTLQVFFLQKHLYLCYVVQLNHFPFIELSGFKLDWFIASNCMHFTSLFGQVQLIRYFSRAESMYFSHFTGLYFSGVVSVVQQLSAVTSLPWQPLSAHSRRQGARKSPTDILSSAQFLVELKVTYRCWWFSIANTEWS